MCLEASENPELRRPQARRVFHNVAAFIASTRLHSIIRFLFVPLQSHYRFCPGGWAASFLCWSYSRLDSQKISGAQWVGKGNIVLKHSFATSNLSFVSSYLEVNGAILLTELAPGGTLKTYIRTYCIHYIIYILICI